MSLSFLNPLFYAAGYALAFFYQIVPNYGVAIILLTVAVRLVLFPLTAKQAKSMMAMQRVQPEIKRLQQKYKGDRAKLNEEMMKFYRENKINPLGGCLPLVLQMPMFIALFRVLRAPQKYLPHGSSLFRAICGNAASARTCRHPQGLQFLGIDLSKTAASNHGGFASALPYFVLIGVLVITTYLQQKQTMRNQSAPNPQMQMVGKVLPLFFAFISLSLPAGVVLYFLVSNLWQMGQQELVLRRYGTVDSPGPKAPALEPNPGQASTTGGGFLARLLNPSPPPNGKEQPPTSGAANGASGTKADEEAAKPKPKPAGSRPARPQGQPRKRSNKKRRR